jgi:integral membrane protein
MPSRAPSPTAVATAFRVVAVTEAVSWVGLLAGMYLKYVPRTTEAGVHLFGPVHGAVFVAFVLVTLLTARVLRWPLRTTLLALAASVPPLATVWFERRASRTGRLSAREAAAAA